MSTRDKVSTFLISIRAKKAETPLILLGLFLFSLFLAYPLLFASIPIPHEFSTPLLPSILSVLSHFFRLTPEVAGRVLVFGFYVLMPLIFFLFVKYLTKDLLFASVSALFYNLPLPLAFIIPSWRMALLAKGIIPIQALALLSEGEMVHIVGLFFLPLAGIFFLKFIRHGSPENLVWGVLVSALLALTSRAALWAFFIFSFTLTVADSLLLRGRLKIKRAAFFTALFLALVAFWYTPLFWSESLEVMVTAGLVRGLGILIPVSLVFLPILGVSIFLLCDRRPKRHVPLIIFLLYLLFGGTVFAGEFLGISFALRPERYLLELHLASSLLWGYITVFGFKLLRQKEVELGLGRLPPYRGGILTAITFLAILSFVVLGGFAMRQTLFKLGQSIHFKGPIEVTFPSLMERPFWDLFLGLLISSVSGLFLLLVVAQPNILRWLLAFLPRHLRRTRKRRERKEK